MNDANHVTATGDREEAAQHLARRLHALLLGGIDMQDVLITAEYLLEHPDTAEQDGGMHWRVRRTLETGMFVAYARPFIHTRKPGLPKLKLARDLSDELLASHDEVLRRRNAVHAHTDETDLRRILQTTSPAGLHEWLWESGELLEQWFSPKPEILSYIAALAKANLAAFLGEIEAIASKDPDSHVSPDAN